MLKKLITALITLSISSSILNAAEKPNLIFYCGITMIKPMTQIAQIVEKQKNCTIKLLQGGSQDLYDSIKTSKKGDLFLPGKDGYLKKNEKDGFFGDYRKYIGYNQAAIFVRKGNPKKVKSLDDLLNPDLTVILCNPKSGSIGKATEEVLKAYKGNDFFNNAYDNAAEIGTDSRNLNKALLDKKADISINWRATVEWDENAKGISIVEIDEKFAPKDKLMLTTLKSSENLDIAKYFIDLAASKEGQAIMRQYGFLD